MLKFKLGRYTMIRHLIIRCTCQFMEKTAASSCKPNVMPMRTWSKYPTTSFQ